MWLARGYQCLVLGELGREAGGTRGFPIAAGLALSVLPLHTCLWGGLDPGPAHTMGSWALLGPTQHHQLGESPQGSTALPTASLSSWPLQMPSLCVGCELFFLLSLSKSWLSLRVLGNACVTPRGEEVCEHPMVWSTEMGTGPVLHLGTQVTVRQEWDRSSQE